MGFSGVRTASGPSWSRTEALMPSSELLSLFFLMCEAVGDDDDDDASFGGT